MRFLSQLICAEPVTLLSLFWNLLENDFSEDNDFLLNRVLFSYFIK